jgi:hypothetical protein
MVHRRTRSLALCIFSALMAWILAARATSLARMFCSRFTAIASTSAVGDAIAGER